MKEAPYSKTTGFKDYLTKEVEFRLTRHICQPYFERPVGKERRGLSRSFKAFEYAEKSLYHAGFQAIKSEVARCFGIGRKEALLPHVRAKTIEN